MARFLFGTSSWSHKGWVGPFYPAGSQPAEYLAHYATRFATVEADVTYYRVPDEKLVRGWDQRTPEDFVLSAKFPRSIVHGGEKAAPDPARILVADAAMRDTEAFLESMALLGKKCGPLVLQFPYFNRGAFASAEPFEERLERYLERLPGAFRYAVEIRNPSWIAPPLVALLRRHETALVLSDLPYMPHPDRLMADLDLVTADFVYARLIGDRKAVDAKTKTFDSIVLDRSARIQRWGGVLRELLAQQPTVHAYANNHFAGHAPATIRELARCVLEDSSERTMP